MTSAARRPLAMLVAAVVVASMAAPGVARATTIGTAFFSGGAGTAVVGGILYARAGSSVTLRVITGAARCVEVSGALEARQVAVSGATTWQFPFIAGSGNAVQEVTVTAWSEGSDTGCAGIAGTPGTARFALDNEGPQLTALTSPAANGAGWHNGNVGIAWSAVDAGSGVQTGPAPATAAQLDETPGALHSATATDLLGNRATASTTVRLDRTPPTITATQDPAPNAAGWNNDDVTVSFACADALSGIADCPAPSTVGGSTAGETVTGKAVDVAGNPSDPVGTTVRIDRDAPVVEFIGGPQDGAVYTAASVPDAPACVATDALSGVDGACEVDGYATTPGTHTLTATARDRAGNVGSATVRYTVSSWTLHGFHQPVAMGGTLNVVKGGSTVPLKFEVFDGATELTSLAAITAFDVRPIGCSTLPTEPEEIEALATGGTRLRYDLADGQFVQTWQTPRTTGTCYQATVTTADGGTLTALFKTR